MKKIFILSYFTLAVFCSNAQLHILQDQLSQLFKRDDTTMQEHINKYSNLEISSLLKNIEKGCEFMNNMEISLEFDKILIMRHNDKDY